MPVLALAVAFAFSFAVPLSFSSMSFSPSWSDADPSTFFPLPCEVWEAAAPIAVDPPSTAFVPPDLAAVLPLAVTPAGARLRTGPVPAASAWSNYTCFPRVCTAAAGLEGAAMGRVGCCTPGAGLGALPVIAAHAASPAAGDADAWSLAPGVACVGTARDPPFPPCTLGIGMTATARYCAGAG